MLWNSILVHIKVYRLHKKLYIKKKKKKKLPKRIESIVLKLEYIIMDIENLKNLLQRYIWDINIYPHVMGLMQYIISLIIVMQCNAAVGRS